MISKRCLVYLTTATFLILAAIVSSSFVTTERRPEKQYVVVVSLDAFRWDYPDRYKTPNLDRIGKSGIRAERMVPSFPANTFPNHYSIATGLYPDNHGIVNNTFFDPESGLLYRIGDRSAVENPYFYMGEPIWVTARKQGVRTASFFWVGSEAPVSGMHPDYWKKYDESVTYEERIDTVIKWLNYPDDRRPQLVMLYFDEPDATSHDFGPVSPETADIVGYLDSLIGVLRQRISKLPFARQVNLIVLSDHGMAEVSSERYVNLYDHVPQRMIDEAWGGNPVILIKPEEGKADSILGFLKNVKGLKAWNKKDLPERWNFGSNSRIPEIVAVADSSWYLSTRKRSSVFKGGAHGYDNRNSDMHSIFYAEGPAFRKGTRPGLLYNTDIYNLICRILNVKPSANNGVMKNIDPLLK